MPISDLETNVIVDNVGKVYLLKNGVYRDPIGLDNNHPLSSVSRLEVYIEDAVPQNVVTITYAPEKMASWATHEFPLWYRGQVEHTITGESTARTFGQYVTYVPTILLALNKNGLTNMSVNCTVVQSTGANLLGAYLTLNALQTEEPLTENGELYANDNYIAYVVEEANKGYYHSVYNTESEVYEWTLITYPLVTYDVDSKQYNVFPIKVQRGFATNQNAITITAEVTRLIYQEIAYINAVIANHTDLISDLNDDIVAHLADLNNPHQVTALQVSYSNLVSLLSSTTVQGAIDEIVANKVEAFQVTPDDIHYPSEKLVKDNLDLKENVANKATAWGTPDDIKYPTTKLVDDRLDPIEIFMGSEESRLQIIESDIDNLEDGTTVIPTYELNENKVVAFSTPTDIQYPSAKLVKDNLDLKEDKANKGQPNGYPDLDESGKVPLAQTYATLNDLTDAHIVGSTPYASDWLSETAGGSPLTPTSGNWYHVVTVGDYEGESYRWSGSAYVLVSSDLILGETSNTAYRGDRGKTAFDHSQVTDGSNPHNTTFANIASKPTTIGGYGITDAYDKTYIDALADFNGWQATNLTPTPLTNGQTISTATLNAKDKLTFVCRDTVTGELDSDELVGALVVNGNKLVFFDNDLIFLTIGGTDSTFTSSVANKELIIWGFETSQQEAENINFDNTESGLTATNVQDAIDEIVATKATRYIDIPLAELNGNTLRGVFEDGIVFDNTLELNNVTSSFAQIVNYNNSSNNKFYIIWELNVVSGTHDNARIESQTPSASNTVTIYPNTPIIFQHVATSTQVRAYIRSTVGLTATSRFIFININTLGLSSLTTAQMDYWYGVYMRYKDDNGMTENVDDILALQKADAEHQNRINAIEEQLRKSTSGENTATKSGTDIISLGGDVANAPINVLVEGGLLDAPQLVTNGDFSNGTTGWNPRITFTTISNVSNALRVNVVNAQINQISTNTSVSTNTTDKFYIKVMLKAPYAQEFWVTNRTDLGFGIANDLSLGIPTVNTFTLLSGIKTFISTQNILTFGYKAVGSYVNGNTFDLDDVFVANISTLISNKQYSPIYDTTFDLMSDAQIKAQMDAWVLDGTLPNDIMAVSMDKRIRSVGKNLANPQYINTVLKSVNINYGFTYDVQDGYNCYKLISGATHTPIYVNFIPNTKYTISGQYKGSLSGSNNSAFYFKYNDGTYAYFRTVTTSWFSLSLTSADGKSVVEFGAYNINQTSVAYIYNFQLELGSTATTYQPYISSDLYLQSGEVGYRLPNLVRDTIEMRNGKAYYVKRVQRYVLQASDITALTTVLSNVDLVEIPITSFDDIVAQTTGYIDYSTLIDGIVETNYSVRNDTLSINKYYTEVNYLVFVVTKGTYASLAQAKTAFAGTVIYYQLATPIETEILAIGNTQVGPNSSIYIDDMKWATDIYTTNITVATAIKELVSITRMNTDGSETQLAVSGATISGDGLSFTHSGLASGDAVRFTYVPVGDYFMGNTDVIYYNNPLIVIDSVTSTVYKIIFTIANGVITVDKVAV